MDAPAASARQRLVGELVAHEDAVIDRIVAAARTQLGGYARWEPPELRPLTARLVISLLSILREGRHPSIAEKRIYREFGVTRARQSITLADMLAAWRLATKEIADTITTIGRSNKHPDRLQLELIRELMDIVDVAIVEFSKGHRAVELANARQDEQARADFVRTVLTGSPADADIAERALFFGIDPDRPWIPFRTRPTAEQPPHAVERALAGPGRTSFTTTVEGDLAGLLDRLPDSSPVALGHAAPTRLDQLPAAFARATRALDTAAAFGLTGPHDLASLGLLPAVLADTEIGDLLTERYVRPLDGTESAAVIIETVRTHLGSGQHAETTARRLVVHPNTVRYRLTRFEVLTGSDLRHENTAVEVWWALQRARLRPPHRAG